MYGCNSPSNSNGFCLLKTLMWAKSHSARKYGLLAAFRMQNQTSGVFTCCTGSASRTKGMPASLASPAHSVYTSAM